MAGFCTNCGKALEDGMAFCTECGTKVEAGTPAAEQVAAAQTAVTAQAVVSHPMAQQSAPDETNQVVKTGKYFGLIFLYGIPVIGLLACVCMSVFPKNKNVKNFSRAMLIWSILGLIVCILIWLGLKALADVLAQMLNELGGGQLGALEGLGDLDLGALEDILNMLPSGVGQ